MGPTVLDTPATRRHHARTAPQTRRHVTHPQRISKLHGKYLRENVNLTWALKAAIIRTALLEICQVGDS